MNKSTSQTFEALTIQIRQLFHKFADIGNRIHAPLDIPMSHRAILEALLKGGPQTVPDIAREKLVSRQHVQKSVNALLDKDLVTLVENPKHLKSSLVSLTKKGERVFKEMRQIELEVFKSIMLPVNQEELQNTQEVLAKLLDYLNSHPLDNF